jgi:hypothetical protein
LGAQFLCDETNRPRALAGSRNFFKRIVAAEIELGINGHKVAKWQVF